MQFRVLGPLEAMRGSESIRLGGERQRALLAFLLLHANQLVSIEQLIESLVGDKRSDSAVSTIRVAVSRLRNALEDDDPDNVLLTRPGGYLLIAGSERLDAAQFERGLELGKQLLDRGEPRAASERLRQALDLWRGPALADLSTVEFLQADIRRLEELRLVATMERIDADLAIGRHTELLAELESLVDAEPMQERLRGQLMLALYRAGRQYDALAVYRAASQLLRDELGLEPSRALRELERSILNQDPILEAVARTTPLPQTDLPVPATPFLGRVLELDEVSASLRRTDTRLLTLTGAGGSGKTRLALRAAETLKLDYLDGAWFVGFGDINDPELIAPTICQAVGLGEQTDLSPVQRLEQWMEGHELLLVLDNLEQLVEGTSLLGELLSACPGLKLLVTSREPLHIAGERQYEVPVLNPDDAVELFASRVQAIGRSPIDTGIIELICERLDRLPLAIELAAARTKALGGREILSRLDECLPLLTGGPRDAPERQRTIRATIDWSYALLDQEQRRLFARLSVFAGGCTLEAAEAVCQAQIDGLESLVDRSLIRTDGDRFWMLQTLREYALEELDQSGVGVAVRQAHARWLIELLEEQHLAPPGWPDERSRGRVTPERENFRAALEWASDSGATEAVARLAASLVGVWITSGQLQEAERWTTVMLEHIDAYEPRLAAQVVSAVRSHAHHRGNHADALVLADRALALWRAVGDPEAIGREMLSSGFIVHLGGELAAGRQRLEHAVQFAREHELDTVLAAALNNLGDLAIHQRELVEGRSLSRESLALSAPGSVSADIARINLAHIASLEGQDAQAIRFARQAVDSALRRGDLLTAAWATIEITWPLARQGALEPSGRLLGAGTGFFETAGAARDWMDEASETATRKILSAMSLTTLPSKRCSTRVARWRLQTQSDANWAPANLFALHASARI